MEKTTTTKSFNIKTNLQLECEGLSENEKIVLMYMKDQKPHDTPPKGMKADVFGVVCEMLKDRQYIKEIKQDFVVAFDQPASYHITPKGYEVVVALEGKREAQNAEERNRLEAIITVDELNSLYANVVKKHGYYHRQQWIPTFWDNAKPYLLRLFASEQPALHIYSIANELSAMKTNTYFWNGYGDVFDGNRIAFKMYLVIYYKYRDHPVYKTMLDALSSVTGVLGGTARMEETRSSLDKVIKTRDIILRGSQQEKVGPAKEILEKGNAPLSESMANETEEFDAGAEEDSGDGTSGYPLKLRIELLNHLLAKAGCSFEQIKEKKLKTTLCKLYHIILGEGADSLLKPCIGKVFYKKKPENLDKKVKDINSLLAKIDEEWKIKL